MSSLCLSWLHSLRYHCTTKYLICSNNVRTVFTAQSAIDHLSFPCGYLTSHWESPKSNWKTKLLESMFIDVWTLSRLYSEMIVTGCWTEWKVRDMSNKSSPEITPGTKAGIKRNSQFGGALKCAMTTQTLMWVLNKIFGTSNEPITWKIVSDGSDRTG